jgi:hypothetical protein
MRVAPFLVVVVAAAVQGGATSPVAEEISAFSGPRFYTATLSFAGDFFIFGGTDGESTKDDVWRLDPETGSLRKVGSLAIPVSYAAAVALGPDGQVAVLFGGHQVERPFPGSLDIVQTFDMKSGRTAVLEAQLPSPRLGLMAVPHLDGAYLFGGRGCVDPCQVLRYDHGEGILIPLAATMPEPRYAGGAASDESAAYIFGGRRGEDPVYLDSILRYSFGSIAVEELGVHLPGPLFSLTASAFNGDILIAGGEYPQYQGQRDVITFDPDAAKITVHRNALPGPSHTISSAANAEYMVISGGGAGQDKIYCIGCPPSAGQTAPPPLPSSGLEGTVDPVEDASPSGAMSLTRSAREGFDWLPLLLALGILQLLAAMAIVAFWAARHRGRFDCNCPPHLRRRGRHGPTCGPSAAPPIGSSDGLDPMPPGKLIPRERR